MFWALQLICHFSRAESPKNFYSRILEEIAVKFSLSPPSMFPLAPSKTVGLNNKIVPLGGLRF